VLLGACERHWASLEILRGTKDEWVCCALILGKSPEDFEFFSGEISEKQRAASLFGA
jgi:hypothetical protein